MKKLIKIKEKDLHKIVKRVITEEKKFHVMDNPTEGKFIIKKWKKRDGEVITKAFIEYEYEYWTGTPGEYQTKDKITKYLPLCEHNIVVGKEIKFDNDFVPYIGPSQNIKTFHNGDPREDCINLNDVTYTDLSEYGPPPSEEEPEDNWWNNEITD